MTSYYADDWLTVYQGDCLEVMAELEPESVNCVVTSPPYWGLRDYGTGTWDGGDAGCDHRVGGQVAQTKHPAEGHTTGQRPGVDASRCGKCNARRIDAQLGLEPTPEAYVASMVEVFREVRRVLRNDGTVWLNLGSSYAAAGASDQSQSPRPERVPAYGTDGTGPQGSPGLGSSYSDLCDGCQAVLSNRTTDTLLPRPAVSPLRSQTNRDIERPGSGSASEVASPLASQESMPPLSSPPPLAECSHCGNCGACLSVLRSPWRDALVCGRRSAYSGGIESQSEPSGARNSGTVSSGLAWGDYTSTIKPKDMVPIPWMVAMALQADGWYLRSDIIWAKANPMPESVTDRPTKAHEYVFLLSKSARYFYDADAVREALRTGDRPGDRASYRPGSASSMNDGEHVRKSDAGLPLNPAGRNLRSVWTIATQPYKGSHFATFPEALVEPCVKAGSSERGVCPTCGASWVREVEQTGAGSRARDLGAKLSVAPGEVRASASARMGRGAGWRKEPQPAVATTGWRPNCAHDAEPVPATVLDPFGGSGTTARVANRLSRRAILIDLSTDYLDQAMVRNAQTVVGL